MDFISIHLWFYSVWIINPVRTVRINFYSERTVLDDMIWQLAHNFAFLEKSQWLRWLLMLTVIWCSTGINQHCRCILMDIWTDKVLGKSGKDFSCEVMRGYWKQFCGFQLLIMNTTLPSCLFSIIINNMLFSQCQSNVPEAFTTEIMQRIIQIYSIQIFI